MRGGVLTAKPAGTAAKKVDEIAARLVTIKEQIAKQRKIDGIVTGADGLAARGSFDDAIKALADLQQLDAATYAKKSEDYKARKTQAEQLIVKQLQSIATKASNAVSMIIRIRYSLSLSANSICFCSVMSREMPNVPTICP